MSSYYGRRYASKKRWIPYEEYIAKKELAKARRELASAKRSVAPRKPRAPRKPKSNGFGQAVGSALGSMLGGSPGAAIGAAVGGGAEELVRKITGFGDYKVNHNSLVTDVDTVPMFKPGQRATMVRHREFIQDIVTSSTPGAFNIDSFPINPAMPETFPWLCEIAEQFEEYRIHGMVFEYKTTSSDALNSTNTALGTVVLATQYNSLSAAFLNKQQMENYEFACSTKPSCSVLHPIECDKFQTPAEVLYTRNSVVNNSGDIRLYDMGRFSIATVGFQGASVNIGELWVSYDIEFLKPRMSDATDVADHFILDAASVTTGVWLGNTALAVRSTTSNFMVNLANNQVIIPPWFSGNIVIELALNVPSASQTAPTLTGTLGATPLNLLFNNTVNYWITPNSETVTKIISTSYWSCVQGGTITFSAGSTGAAGTVVVADLVVSSISSDLTN